MYYLGVSSVVKYICPLCVGWVFICYNLSEKYIHILECFQYYDVFYLHVWWRYSFGGRHLFLCLLSLCSRSCQPSSSTVFISNKPLLLLLEILIVHLFNLGKTCRKLCIYKLCLGWITIMFINHWERVVTLMYLKMQQIITNIMMRHVKFPHSPTPFKTKSDYGTLRCM